MSSDSEMDDAPTTASTTTFDFPGKYAQPGDEGLVDRLNSPVPRPQKPKPVRIEGIDEDIGYSSDEEKWEMLEPPRKPSLQITVGADADE